MTDRIDATFSVPFTHRVRFTHDLFTPTEQHVLLDILHRTGPTPARVLLCVETEVEAATAIAKKFESFAAQFASEVALVGSRILDGGESLKNNPLPLRSVLADVLSHSLDRHSYVVAAGGGGFLDAIGLAVSLAHRGLRLIRLPTTTMGQADSGMGVKNAVNFFDKKNWLGTFAVPWAVINDFSLLQSLPDRDWRCGFAEAVKVALLKDAGFFQRLCVDASRIADRDAEPSRAAIARSAVLHLEHITRGGDPFEATEARPLDFGHWAAHRLEALTDFSMRHGEAVAIGLAIDCAYSRLAHGLPADAEQAIRNCLSNFRLPLTHPALKNPAMLLEGLEEFRQHLGGRLTVTMLTAVGNPIDVHEIDDRLMGMAIESVVENSSAFVDGHY